MVIFNANPSRLRIVVPVAQQFKQNLLHETGTSANTTVHAAELLNLIRNLLVEPLKKVLYLFLKATRLPRHQTSAEDRARIT